MKSIVVAYDQQRGIGANNDLLWQRDLPADLTHFKDLTIGRSIVMGRKTLESIGHALPGRENIVVTSSEVAMPDVAVAHSLVEAYQLAAYPDIVVIGGASIYEQTIDDMDVVYATEVQASFPEAEVFFPVLGSEWHETSRESHSADVRNKYDYDFVTYTRR